MRHCQKHDVRCSIDGHLIDQTSTLTSTVMTLVLIKTIVEGRYLLTQPLELFDVSRWDLWALGNPASEDHVVWPGQLAASVA